MDLNGGELHRKIVITRLIHEDKNIARILVATMKRPLSVPQISKRCNIPPGKCLHMIKKLKKNGLIKAVKKVVSEENPGNVIFLYKAQLDRTLIRFKNGRFKVKFPKEFFLSNGQKIDIKTFIESSSS